MGRAEMIAESLTWRETVKERAEWERAAMVAAMVHNVQSKQKVKTDKLIGKKPKRNLPHEIEAEKRKKEELRRQAEERGMAPNGE